MFGHRVIWTEGKQEEVVMCRMGSHLFLLMYARDLDSRIQARLRDRYCQAMPGGKVVSAAGSSVALLLLLPWLGTKPAVVQGPESSLGSELMRTPELRRLGGGKIVVFPSELSWTCAAGGLKLGVSDFWWMAVGEQNSHNKAMNNAEIIPTASWLGTTDELPKRYRIRKAKAEIEQDSPRDVKNNKKGFYKYIGQKRKDKESVQDEYEKGEPVTTDMEKAEESQHDILISKLETGGFHDGLYSG
ncbi:hypothetical protein BTVI_15080 [Pitangus sulphuratus]|nr:hypothetical protein BTVI_15080 [Pitangus sulphuratus]